MSSRVLHDATGLPRIVQVTASDLVGQQRGTCYRVLGDFFPVNEPAVGFLRNERGAYWKFQKDARGGNR